MAGFVSVGRGVRGAGVVARVVGRGCVWAWRALPAGAGWSPAPACLFVPFASPHAAQACAAFAARALCLRAWVRPGSSGSPVWAACGLPAPAWAVKVALPRGRFTRAVLVSLGAA